MFDYNNQYFPAPCAPYEFRRAFEDALYVRLQQPIPPGVLLETLCKFKYNIKILTVK